MQFIWICQMEIAALSEAVGKAGSDRPRRMRLPGGAPSLFLRI